MLRREGLAEVISFIEAAGGLESLSAKYKGATRHHHDTFIWGFLDDRRVLLRPIHDPETAIEMLDKGGAARHPITIIQIVNAADHPVVWCMNVSTNHALAAARLGVADYSFLKPRSNFIAFFTLCFI